MSHPVVHWEIGGPDKEALRDFYADLFGWKAEEAGPEYALLEPGEGPSGGIMRTKGGMPPYVTIYVQVEDLEAALARAAELGGSRVVPPTEISAELRFAMFADPMGNVVGLLSGAGSR
ncbi:VOC family protein [Actinomadura sp. ATCC 31491]|uniref:VOC family protein n=1 Tax=Actinomadura luzonensis TaxID=2805427 RepID=A0ABT0G381_9ACTN|nr:VOC family protein [Actinomadura luzonensis]MCK2219053.1 VOC family protein [Actinomadura luzonensis]